MVTGYLVGAGLAFVLAYGVSGILKLPLAPIWIVILHAALVGAVLYMGLAAHRVQVLEKKHGLTRKLERLPRVGKLRQ